MHECDVGLQTAIDILTEMLAQRVEDYVELKNRLPSFGPDVDLELGRYLHALENFVQGTVLWYYLSPSKTSRQSHISFTTLTLSHKGTSVVLMSATEIT
jgi:hypothetical protein